MRKYISLILALMLLLLLSVADADESVGKPIKQKQDGFENTIGNIWNSVIAGINGMITDVNDWIITKK